MSIRKPRIVNNIIIANESFTVYDSTIKNDSNTLDALDASVTLNIDGASSSATIRMAQGTKINGRTYIEMFTVQGSAGIFRTRSPQIGYGGQYTTIQLEHSINQLGDIIYADKVQKEYSTLKTAMQAVFTAYNKKDAKFWQLGTVETPDDPSADGETATNCVLDVDYDNCLEAIEGLLEQFPFMMMTFNFSTFPWKLNIVNKPIGVTAEGRITRNVKSAVVTRDDSELATRVYMEGYTGNKDKNNVGYYGTSSAINKYGLVETVISGANDTSAIATRTVKSYYKTHKKPRTNITIEGIELSNITGESLDKFTIGKLFRLALPAYGTTVTENITGLAFQSVYKSPNSVTVTLNDEADKVIKYIKKAQKSASKAAKSAGSVAKAAFVDASVSNNILYLTKGDGTKLAFSKAVTLEGSWSGGTYTVRAYQNNVNSTTGKVEKINVVTNKTKLNDITLQANKSPSVVGDYNLKIPLKVMYDNGLPSSQGNKSNTEYQKDVTVSALKVYNNGFSNAASRVSVPSSIGVGTIKSTATLKYPYYLAGSKMTITEKYALIPDILPSASGHVQLIRGDASGQAIAAVARISIGSWYTAGANATTINAPTWSTSPSSTISVSTNTATFKTNASDPNQRTLKIILSNSGWSSGTNTVYAYHTSETSSYRIAKFAISLPSKSFGTISYSSSASGTSAGKSISRTSVSNTSNKYLMIPITMGGSTTTYYFSLS